MFLGEEHQLFGSKGMLFVVVAEKADFLRAHQVKVTLFASIIPGPDATVVCQGHSTKAAQQHPSLSSPIQSSVNGHMMFNPCIVLIILSGNSRLTFTPHVQLAIFSNVI